MKYLFLVIIGLLISLWFVKIKLEIEVSKEKTKGNVIISNLFKYKISLNKTFDSKPKKLKDIFKILKMITNPLIKTVFSKAIIEKVDVELYMKEDDNPYLIFTGHLFLMKLRNLLYKYFKKVRKEKFKIGLEDEKSQGRIIVSINLGKLVTIILQNYDCFKKIISTK